MCKLTIKERMLIDRVKMIEQDGVKRASNFDEVNLGLTLELAQQEAKRCIACKTQPCVNGCPVGVRIPDFISAVADGDLHKAASILHEDNALPATTGRVCPQELQCEGVCVRGVKGKSVAIGFLERFVADWARENLSFQTSSKINTNFKVAIVGSGPAGLTAAGELARMGHRVHIFEALHDTGGVLRYGIPEFRLPKNIVDYEVERLCALGVTIECNVIVGMTITIDDILQEFDAVFVANGAGLPMFLNIPGENLKGVYSANEYLTRVNLMGAWSYTNCDTPIIRGDTVLVFGGGNVAMDAVRTAKRLGARRAICVYRRTKTEMPARIEEIKHAEEEGVEFMYLLSPLTINGNNNGWVESVKLQKMELGEPDASGRCRPIPMINSEHEIPCDIVIVALGTNANPLLTNATPSIILNKWKNIVVDDTQTTSMNGVFAGGDIVRGGATVILAMGDGKSAAQSINNYLEQKERK